jgi:spore coat protein H
MKKTLIITILSFMLFACSKDFMNPQDDISHSVNTTPDYPAVFNQNKINKIEIVVTSKLWDSVMNNIDTVITNYQRERGFTTVKNAKLRNLRTVPVVVRFNGKAWNRVGFKLLDSQGMISGLVNGSQKLPFSLELDKFGAIYPEIQGQKMYGFKQLTFQAATDDYSLIREKVVADMYKEMNVPYPQTAFCEVNINFGNNSIYCGIYTISEGMNEQFLENTFNEKTGNLHRPNSFLNTFNQAEFEQITNKNNLNYTDIQRFIAAVNQPIRKTNPAKWRNDLEETFDVNSFIKWLAINTTMGNGDKYGKWARNYYLYSSPSKKLTWLDFDNTRSFQNPILLTPTTATAAEKTAVSLDLKNVDATWVLIRNIAEDEVYFAEYRKQIKEFRRFFNETYMNSLFEKHTIFIRDYINGSKVERVPYTNLRNTSDFEKALPALKTWVSDRNKAIDEFLK